MEDDAQAAQLLADASQSEKEAVRDVQVVAGTDKSQGGVGGNSDDCANASSPAVASPSQVHSSPDDGDPVVSMSASVGHVETVQEDDLRQERRLQQEVELRSMHNRLHRGLKNIVGAEEHVSAPGGVASLPWPFG